MERTDPQNSRLSDLMLDVGKALTRSGGSDAPMEDLMRVADDPLRLKALVVRQGTGTVDILPPLRAHLRDSLLGKYLQAGMQSGQERAYGVVEQLQPESLRPEVFEPRDEDKTRALWMSRDPVDAKPVWWHGRLVAGFAVAGFLAHVLLSVFT